MKWKERPARSMTVKKVEKLGYLTDMSLGYPSFISTPLRRYLLCTPPLVRIWLSTRYSVISTFISLCCFCFLTLNLLQIFFSSWYGLLTNFELNYLVLFFFMRTDRRKRKTMLICPYLHIHTFSSLPFSLSCCLVDHKLNQSDYSLPPRLPRLH